MTGLIFAGAYTQTLRAGVITNAGLGGFGSYTISGFALAAFEGVDMIGFPDPDFASASANALGSTDGPVRSCLLKLAEVAAENSGVAAALWAISASGARTIVSRESSEAASRWTAVSNTSRRLLALRWVTDRDRS